MFFRHLYLAVWAYWGAVELRLINMDERIAVGTRYFAVDPALGCALAEEGYPLVLPNPTIGTIGTHWYYPTQTSGYYQAIRSDEP